MSLQSLEPEWEDSSSSFVQLLVSLSSCCHGLGLIFPSRDTGEAPQAHCSCCSQALCLQGEQPAGRSYVRQEKEERFWRGWRCNCCRLASRENPSRWDQLLPHLSSGCCHSPFLFQDLSDAAEGRELEMGLYSHEMPQSSNFHSFRP